MSVAWKEPETIDTTGTIREQRIPAFRGRSHLESRFIQEIDTAEEKDKLNYCWQMYAKMVCLCFGILFMILIFLASVVPIAFIYINQNELIVDYMSKKILQCPFTTLCPELDCEGYQSIYDNQ